MSTGLNQGIQALLERIDAPTATFFSTCVNCGMCAEACLFFTETRDPKYTPIYKLRPMKRLWRQHYTFWGKLASRLGLSRPVTDQELSDWEELVYDSCTLCGRCSMVCPVGNDIVYMVRRMREGMVASGHAPADLKAATARSIRVGSPMGIKLPAFQAQVRHAEQETGLPIPMDQEDADYMLLMSSAEIIQFPEFLSACARIFDHAGVSWTMCSTAYEGTNSGIQIGSSDLAGELVQRIVDGAERLRVKAVISPECGHAYTALRWEGPNLIGRAYRFKVLHILELLDELRAEGRLLTEGTEDARLTFHDPCQLVRRGGVVQQPRNLLKMVATDFVEMEDNGTMNWCCGGGGGVSAIERAAPLRSKAFKRKKKQLEGLEVSTMVTACSNCRNMLEEGLEENNMEVSVVGLTEMIADHLAMAKPERPVESKQ